MIWANNMTTMTTSIGTGFSGVPNPIVTYPDAGWMTQYYFYYTTTVVEVVPVGTITRVNMQEPCCGPCAVSVNGLSVIFWPKLASQSQRPLVVDSQKSYVDGTGFTLYAVSRFFLTKMVLDFAGEKHLPQRLSRIDVSWAHDSCGAVGPVLSSSEAIRY